MPPAPDNVPLAGNCDAPPSAVTTPRRTITPLAQSNPSPNVNPAPPPAAALACRYMHGPDGRVSARRRAVSAPRLGQPSNVRRAPLPSELMQPALLPAALGFPQGQAVPDPSPAQ